MKRSGPPKRVKPLRSTPFVSRSEVLPNAGMKRKPWVLKRPVVTGAERSARKTLRKRAQQRCEGCGAYGPTDYSHRVNEGQGGPWAASNAMALDRRCHTWLHANPLAARELGWYLRGHEDYRSIPVVHAWLGRVLLNDDGSTTRIEKAA